MLNGDKLKEYAQICRENKISRLVLADGTTLEMHVLAFYDTDLGQNLPSQGEFPSQGLEDADTIDEDVLFASAR